MKKIKEIQEGKAALKFIRNKDNLRLFQDIIKLLFPEDKKVPIGNQMYYFENPKNLETWVGRENMQMYYLNEIFVIDKAYTLDEIVQEYATNALELLKQGKIVLKNDYVIPGFATTNRILNKLFNASQPIHTTRLHNFYGTHNGTKVNFESYATTTRPAYPVAIFKQALMLDAKIVLSTEPKPIQLLNNPKEALTIINNTKNIVLKRELARLWGQDIVLNKTPKLYTHSPIYSKLLEENSKAINDIIKKEPWIPGKLYFVKSLNGTTWSLRYAANTKGNFYLNQCKKGTTFSSWKVYKLATGVTLPE